MKRILALLLALTMLFALCACGAETPAPAAPAEEPAAEAPAAEPADAPADEAPAEEPAEAPADEESFTFIVNLNKGEPGSAQEIAWMAAVTEATGGTITFEPYFNTLLSPAEVPEGLASGVIDIAVASASEYPTILTRSSYLATMPFSGIKGEDFYGVYDALYQENEDVRKEYEDAGMVLLTFGFGPALNAFTVDSAKELNTPDDLKGMQMLATQAMIQNYIADQGGAPVSAGPGDFYSYLERSVSDGIFIHWGMMCTFALAEVVNHAVIFGSDPTCGITQDLNVIVMSQDVWNKLSDRQKAAFESCRETYWEEFLVVAQSLTDRAMDMLTERGANIEYLTEEQVQAWQDAFTPVRDRVLEEVDAEQGTNLVELYQRVLELDEELNG